ncbi:SH3 domain-containing protein [Sulfurisoma sediminicola]|uniref:SH3 domain-containing protein n=1 Tax=Sulfurisoma sediminicola TaxID=1381557 RepID=A0A497XIT1_9PROT|nr:SH3 domain-containing protein [Sulfurisoma sediminicola]RLJ67801.1 SH3 domain-containing protein [Sulfurisoma sediminicola]
MMRFLAPLLALLLAGPALALDFHSVAEATVLYDAPSQKAKPLFAIARGTPLELVVTVEGWVKVRDQKGDLAWIEKRLLAEKRTVIVRADRAQVRAQADDKAPLVFDAEKDVVLDLVDSAAAGWAKVRHRDGQLGFVKAAQVWGL